MGEQTPERWEIDQDEAGRPLVRHRHASMAVTALVTDDADGIRTARCPDCEERYRLEADH
jgi:hypothetical protein